MLKGSRQRSRTSRVMGNGNSILSCPLASLPVNNKVSSCKCPRATVSPGIGRAEVPSANRSLGVYGRYAGWRPIFWLQPTTNALTITRNTTRTGDLVRYIRHLASPQLAQKRRRPGWVEQRVIRLDAQKESIPGRPRKAGQVEHRMIRLGVSVQDEQARKARACCKQQRT